MHVRLFCTMRMKTPAEGYGAGGGGAIEHRLEGAGETGERDEVKSNGMAECMEGSAGLGRKMSAKRASS